MPALSWQESADGSSEDLLQIETKVNQMMSELFELELSEITPKSNVFTDLGLDSLDAIDLVVSFQKEFGIKPSNDELQKIRTMEDVYTFCLLYTSPSPRDRQKSRMPSSA